MISKDFHVFLLQFSEKIQSVRLQASYSPQDLENVDSVIEGLLDLAQRVYGAEMDELLKHHRIDSTLIEMKDTVAGHLAFIYDFRTIHTTDHTPDQLVINYHGHEYTWPLLDIPAVIEMYFKIPQELTEYNFVTAYLARTDHYDIIQIYHFLRSRLN